MFPWTGRSSHSNRISIARGFCWLYVVELLPSKQKFISNTRKENFSHSFLARKFFTKQFRSLSLSLPHSTHAFPGNLLPQNITSKGCFIFIFLRVSTKVDSNQK
jgi:hypothetical protein